MQKLLVTSFIIFFFISASSQDSVSYCKHIKSHRASAKQTFAKMGDSPLTEDDTKNMKFFKPKKKYKVESNIRLIKGAKKFEMPTYSGMKKLFQKYAEIDFKLNGRSYSLSAYQNVKHASVDKAHLFIPFKDDTNDASTYGGGRYIDLSTRDISDGIIILDFNKAYNPWCAYSDGYNCPIPPGENHLPLEIKAGEKKYTGMKNQRLSK